MSWNLLQKTSQLFRRQKGSRRIVRVADKNDFSALSHGIQYSIHIIDMITRQWHFDRCTSHGESRSPIAAERRRTVYDFIPFIDIRTANHRYKVVSTIPNDKLLRIQLV